MKKRQIAFVPVLEYARKYGRFRDVFESARARAPGQ